MPCAGKGWTQIRTLTGRGRIVRQVLNSVISLNSHQMDTGGDTEFVISGLK